MKKTILHFIPTPPKTREDTYVGLCGYIIDPTKPYHTNANSEAWHGSVVYNPLESFVQKQKNNGYIACQECLKHPDYPLHLLRLSL